MEQSPREGTRGHLAGDPWGPVGPECLASRRGCGSGVSPDVWRVENWVVSEAPRHRVVEHWKLLSFRQSREQQRPGGPRAGWTSPSSARISGAGTGLQTVVGVGARCGGLASSPLPLGSSYPSLCQGAREVGVCAGFSELTSGSCLKEGLAATPGIPTTVQSPRMCERLSAPRQHAPPEAFVSACVDNCL